MYRAVKGREGREVFCVFGEGGLYVSWLGVGCMFYEMGSTWRGGGCRSGER